MTWYKGDSCRMLESNTSQLDQRKLHRRQGSLSAKLALVMIAMVVVTVAVVTLVSIRREQQTFRRELQQQADVLLDSLTVATSDSLYRLDVAYLEGLMLRLGQAEIVESGRVYDANGRVVADAGLPEILVFSLESDTFGKELLESDSAIFRWEPTRLLAGRAVVVGNQRLGALSVELSTAPLAAKMAAVRTQGIAVAALAVVAGTTLALLLSRSITGPLRALTEATEHLAGGDFERRVVVRSGDELAVLGDAFNSMVTRIQEQFAELAETNLQLTEAREKAEEVSHLKSQFLATMSHELRTPLNSVIGYSDLLIDGLRGPLNEGQEDYAERILANGERLLRLINEILDISKIEAGRLELIDKSFTPGELVANVKKELQSLADGKDLRLNTLVDPDLPSPMLGDPTRLEQILVNLVGNAIKFTESGQIDVQLKKSDNSHWRMMVVDTGIGIPPHAIEYIFDEFRQVDGSTSREYGGTGLGLAIVQKLTKLMGGTINVKSEVSKGSTFTVHIPLRVPEMHTVKEKQP